MNEGMHDYLFDQLIEGFETFDYSVDVTTLNTDGVFFLSNIGLTVDDGYLEVFTMDAEKRRSKVTTLGKKHDRKKYKQLLSLYDTYYAELVKKKDQHNIPTLKRLLDGDVYVDSTYFEFRADASSEVIRFYYGDYSVRTMHFVDKKTHALFLLERPKYRAWLHENEIRQDGERGYW